MRQFASNPLVFVRYCFKIQEMRIRVGKADPWQLGDVPDPFQTQKIRDDTVSEDLYSLQYVLDWFVVETIVKTWYDEDAYYDDDELAKWYSD